jgi:SAM-dependent methyltransferase/thymidine kinase
MTITILTGPSGSGKSKHLIERVNAARASGQAVRTFLSSKAVIAAPDPNLWMHGVIASRDPSMTTPLDHVVSIDECGEILRSLPRGSLAAFDEAFYFDEDVTDHWSHAAGRGIDVLVSTPSAAQLQRLVREDTLEKRLTMRCQECRRREATESFLLPGKNDATSVCPNCAAKLITAIRSELVSRLQSQAPYPGEKAIYQPVELEECADWQILRPDSGARVELLTSIVSDVEERTGTRPESYMDVGCNTGYFCSAMAAAGLAAIGVDVVEGDIDVAALLTAAVRRDRCQFVLADVYEYLRDTREQQIEVISAFSVIQWLILQRSLEHGVEALNWLFEKSGQACVLEMGYPSEEIYRDKLPPVIDRDWVRNLMIESGRFAEVRCFPAREGGLMRDVFVGFVPDSDRANRPLRVITSLGSAPPYDHAEDIVLRLAPVIRKLTQGELASDNFRSLEEHGVHVTPVSFYQPVPELRTLSETLWTQPSTFGGIDMNESEQIRLVSQVFPEFAEECSALPVRQSNAADDFFIGNGMFDGTDALIYYCLVRHLRPSRIVEVGSGFSTALALVASRRNGGAEVVAIDPHPSKVLEAMRSRITEVIARPVQEVDSRRFEALEAGDILFIDSSHVARIGSDVNYLILEVLPRLQEGVLVHFHDVFLPFEYPKAWVLDKLRFWTEQYLLQAFLAFNSDYEIVLANNFLGMNHRDLLRETFPDSPWWGGGSFWIRRQQKAVVQAEAKRRRRRI